MRPAAAAERIELRNGFSLVCDHRELLANGRVRLLLEQGGSLDIDAGAVLLVEPLEARASTGFAQRHLASSTVSAPLASMIATTGVARNINLDLLQSVIQAESGGRVHAVSRAGAQGLMQLMPSTARSLGVHDSFAPEENLRGGAAYLDSLLTRYHDDLALALAAYNAGPGAVDRYHGVPPYRETVAYVSRIIREFNRRTLAQQRLVAQQHKAALLTGARLP